jgi:hypothetical protein
VDNSADQINAFQALGVGTLCYLRLLDADDVLALVPDAQIAPTEPLVH